MPPTGHKPVPNPADLELGTASPGPPAHRFPWENSWNEMAPAVAAAPRAQYPPFLCEEIPAPLPCPHWPSPLWPSSWHSREGEEEGGGSH